MLDFQILKFEELSNSQLYELLKLRQEVFIVEQDCPYLDSDGLDYESLHLLAYNDKDLVAYARILKAGLAYQDYSSIGRVVNAKAVRSSGIGKVLMKKAIEICPDKYPNTDIKISAQEYLDQFYTKLGFVKTGDHYLEDGIPHQAMILKSSL